MLGLFTVQNLLGGSQGGWWVRVLETGKLLFGNVKKVNMLCPMLQVTFNFFIFNPDRDLSLTLTKCHV